MNGKSLRSYFIFIFCLGFIGTLIGSCGNRQHCDAYDGGGTKTTQKKEKSNSTGWSYNAPATTTTTTPTNSGTKTYYYTSGRKGDANKNYAGSPGGGQQLQWRKVTAEENIDRRNYKDASYRNSEDANIGNAFIQGVDAPDMVVDEAEPEQVLMDLERKESSSSSSAVQYNKLVSKADQYYEEGNYEKSRELYVRAMNMNPSNVYAKERVDEIDGKNMITLSEDSVGLAEKTIELKDRTIPDEMTMYERYNPYTENEWIATADEVKSTFSIDVDNASYTNFRRFINEGYLPPKDAIRVEEWLNFFNYELEAPAETDEHPLKITSEVGPCPWDDESELVMIKMQAKKPVDELPPSNLVFLVDVSGSMGQPNKLPLVQESMMLLTKKLRRQDRISIVTYAGSSTIALKPTAGNETAKIKEAIASLTSGGGTAGSKGIETAYKLAEENFDATGNNRIIVASDGDWNIGITGQDDLKKLIEKKRESGVYLSVLGFGMRNLNDAMMETIADHGNGNYAYIDSKKESQRIFDSEFAGQMYTVAKDVKLQVEFNSAEVEEYRLLGYENRVLENWMFNDDAIDAGDLGMGQNVIAFYQVKRSEGARGSLGKVDFRYKPLDSDVSTLLTHNFEKHSDVVSDDYEFASCVIEFAMCLRESEYRDNASMARAIYRGKQNLGDPKENKLSYDKRVEFVGLMEPVAELYNDYVYEEAADITETQTPQLKLFPNPAKTTTTIEVPEEVTGKWSIQIFNMDGGLARVEHFVDTNRGLIDVSSLPRAAYIIKVYGNGVNYGYLRLVVQ